MTVRLLPLVGVLLLAACGGEPSTAPSPTPQQPPPQEPPRPYTLSVDVDSVAVTEGQTRQLVATLRDATGAVVQGVTAVWQSLDETVLRVEAGLLTAVGQGHSAIRVTAAGVEREVPVRVAPDFGGELLLVSQDTASQQPLIYRLAAPATADSLVPVMTAAPAEHPAVAPDGRRVAYTCDAGGPAICVLDLESGASRVLTGDDAFAEDQPTWSPDGQWLAFRRWTPGAGTPGDDIQTDIWMMTAEGASQRNLTDDAWSQHEPSFAPQLVDGTFLLAFSEGPTPGPLGFGDLHLSWMRSDGSHRELLTAESGARDMQPRWSPDGQSLAYTQRSAEGSYQLRVWSALTRQTRALLATPMHGMQSSPAWSPNGRYVAFAAQPIVPGGPIWVLYRLQVFTARADGSGVVQRTSGGSGKHQLAWRTLP